jgi:bacterioferritin (cytochrome b1)
MDLNTFIMDLDREEPSFRDRFEFFTGLKKLAALMEEEAAAAPPQEGEEPPRVEESVGRSYEGEPDTMGVLEGQFAAPVEDVVNTMVSLVGIEMKLQLAYLYYAEMIRGPGRDELSELFQELAEEEAADASYFLRRISVLTSGQGVPMPPVPAPQPLADRESILKQLLAYEQQAIVFLKVLRQQLGDNPMKFTVEEMLTEEQEHIDRLWQHMPEAAPTKVAAAMRRIKAAAAADVVAGAQALPAAPEVVIQQQQADLQQLMAEREHLVATAQHLEETAHQNAAAAESAGAEVQQAQQQAQMVQQQAQQAQMQAQQATEQAAASEENAAQQAEAKMRLAMRIQQFRQQMADLAASDPVGEEGLAFGEQAAAGSPQTQQQQQQQAQAEAEEQQAQVEQAAQVDPETRKQQAEAERAQDQAEQQKAQVEHAASKVSSLGMTAVRRARDTAGGVLRKTTPTQALGRMELPRHLAKTNPQAAIHSGVKHKMPVVASSNVLDQLSRTSFDKLSRLLDLRKARGQR